MKNKSKASLSQAILEYLFQLNPSEEKPTTEDILAKRFRVSRTPVRDALKNLERDDFIVRKKKKGIYIKPLSLNEIIAIYDLRAVLEGFAARIAVLKAGPEDLDELEELAERYTEYREQGELDKAEVADLGFHEKIIGLAGNPFLHRIMENFNILHRAFKLKYPDPSYRSRNVHSYPHEKVVEALKQGDPDECERSLKLHVQYSKQYIVEDAFGFKMQHFDT